MAGQRYIQPVFSVNRQARDSTHPPIKCSFRIFPQYAELKIVLTWSRGRTCDIFLIKRPENFHLLECLFYYFYYCLSYRCKLNLSSKRERYEVKWPSCCWTNIMKVQQAINNKYVREYFLLNDAILRQVRPMIIILFNFQNFPYFILFCVQRA